MSHRLTFHSPLFFREIVDVDRWHVVESDGPPSWSLDASETGNSTKYPWVGLMGTHGYFVPSPVSSQETKMAACRTQRSTSTISRKNSGLWTVYVQVKSLNVQEKEFINQPKPNFSFQCLLVSRFVLVHELGRCRIFAVTSKIFDVYVSVMGSVYIANKLTHLPGRGRERLTNEWLTLKEGNLSTFLSYSFHLLGKTRFLRTLFQQFSRIYRWTVQQRQ